MGHAQQPDELLEVAGDELRAVVADDPRVLVGELLFGPLHDDLHVLLRHRSADLPMDDVAAVAVEHADEVVERAGDVEVADVDVPVFVGRRGWTKPVPLREGWAQRRPSRPACFNTR